MDRRIPAVCLCESFSAKRALREEDFFFVRFEKRRTNSQGGENQNAE